MFQSYIALGAAIVLEVAGSSFLLVSQQFTRLVPALAVLIFYGLSFYALSLALRHIPLGVAYAIWSGVGIVLTALVGLMFFRQALDLPAVVGIAFIIIGVVIMNTMSRAVVP